MYDLPIPITNTCAANQLSKLYAVIGCVKWKRWANSVDWADRQTDHNVAQCLHGFCYHGSDLKRSGLVQEERLDKKPQMEEFHDNFYGDLYDDLDVSMVTVGPNISDYEVS